MTDRNNWINKNNVIQVANISDAGLNCLKSECSKWWAHHIFRWPAKLSRKLPKHMEIDIMIMHLCQLAAGWPYQIPISGCPGQLAPLNSQVFNWSNSNFAAFVFDNRYKCLSLYHQMITGILFTGYCLVFLPAILRFI